MSGTYPSKILSGIEDKITEVVIPDPMPGDRFILASAMQKAIRRGHSETAMKAALALWLQDRQAFFRRITTVAFEDVGVAAPEAVSAICASACSSAWRKSVGEMKAIIVMADILSRSPKTRIADALFIQAERSKEYEKLRNTLTVASDEKLSDFVRNKKKPLIERSLGLWYLFGQGRFPSDLIPKRRGSTEVGIDVLRELGAPECLVEGSISAMSRASHPLSVFTPLIWCEIQKSKLNVEIVECNLPSLSLIEEIPDYSADVFTRVGQQCFRKLQKTVPDLKRFTVKQIGLAVFYIDGALIDRVLTSDSLERFQLEGEFTDAEASGLCIPSYIGIKECLSENMGLLREIREQVLKQYLNGSFE